MIQELTNRLPFLNKEEVELRALTEGTLTKLERMIDKEFSEIEMRSDFNIW